MGGFPNFYSQVPRLVLRDPLAEFLGALDAGIVKFSYVEAVKFAGHSCPTVASAYLMTCKALAHLYGEALPVRGEIRVGFTAAESEGVAGVIANVAGMLTGAAGKGGFRGIGGRFGRRDLLRFGVDGVAGSARFERLDSGTAVDAEVDLSGVPADPEMPDLLQRCLSGAGTLEQARRFHALWQGRVRAILIDHWDDPRLLRLRPR